MDADHIFTFFSVNENRCISIQIYWSLCLDICISLIDFTPIQVGSVEICLEQKLNLSTYWYPGSLQKRNWVQGLIITYIYITLCDAITHICSNSDGSSTKSMVMCDYISQKTASCLDFKKKKLVNERHPRWNEWTTIFENISEQDISSILIQAPM